MRKTLSILVIVVLCCSTLPALPTTAFADFSASSAKVLGVGRIQSTTNSITIDTEHKLKELEVKVDSNKTSQLAKPIGREIADPTATNKSTATTTPDTTNKTESPSPSDEAWNEGSATAYGPTGSAVWRTADGSDLTSNTYGVAVPIEWKSKYFGKTLEIEYNGIRVYAKVTDVGAFLKYGRSLDLQPGVFKAFGFKSANLWGVRDVRWRVVS